jgi:hypothetical protein
MLYQLDLAVYYRRYAELAWVLAAGFGYLDSQDGLENGTNG